MAAKGESIKLVSGASNISKSDRRLLAGAVIATVASGIAHFADGASVVAFVITGAALGILAALVGRSVDRLGDRLGSGATGFIQSALGNLPELFIGIFALRAGLVGVVQAALVGSILANLLLVLGVAFIAGGLRNGTQTFSATAARLSMLLLVLGVAIVLVPSIAVRLHGPASHHAGAISNVAAVILLALFVLSIPASLQSVQTEIREEGPRWSLPVVLVILALSSAAAAVVSDWFIGALSPALVTLHISQAFAGLVIVAIAGNAVENFVGVKLAVANRPDYALSVILQSPVQIALGLFPVLVLLSNAVGPTPLTLVMPTLLVVSLALGVVVGMFVVFDGESTWLEGATLIGLYAVIATAFWWG
jgi:Ca2+:H+ antiporter